MQPPNNAKREARAKLATPARCVVVWVLGLGLSGAQGLDGEMLPTRRAWHAGTSRFGASGGALTGALARLGEFGGGLAVVLGKVQRGVAGGPPQRHVGGVCPRRAFAALAALGVVLHSVGLELLNNVALRVLLHLALRSLLDSR